MSRSSERQAADVAEELARCAEIRGVLSDLHSAGIPSVLIKGTALAYSIYARPYDRARDDTDLMIDERDVDRVMSVFQARGYDRPAYCDELFSQFVVQKTDRCGIAHAFDIHWKFSTQSVFADVLTFSDLLASAVAVPALGSHALRAGNVHSLLIACVHPTMHHRNAEAAEWSADVDLLAAALTSDDWRRFAELARVKRVAAICARRLARAADRVSVPPSVLAALSSATGEPSAEYLSASRRWHHELLSNLRHFPGWRARVHHLREVLLPRPAYMLQSYGWSSRGAALLPVLYVHRNIRGIWKIVTGRK